MVDRKPCSGCGEPKEPTDYYIADKATGRRKTTCKACVKQASARWKVANPERVAAQPSGQAEYRQTAWQRWYSDNKDSHLARSKERKADNREQYRLYKSAYRARKLNARTAPYPRADIFARWGGLCGYGCGEQATELDHITPLSRGGDDVESNLIPACSSENRSKGAKLLWEWALTFAPEIKDN